MIQLKKKKNPEWSRYPTPTQVTPELGGGSQAYGKHKVWRRKLLTIIKGVEGPTFKCLSGFGRCPLWAFPNNFQTMNREKQQRFWGRDSLVRTCCGRLCFKCMGWGLAAKEPKNSVKLGIKKGSGRLRDVWPILKELLFTELSFWDGNALSSPCLKTKRILV